MVHAWNATCYWGSGAQDPTVRFSTTSLGQGANTALPIYGFFMKDVYADETLEISPGRFPGTKTPGRIH